MGQSALITIRGLSHSYTTRTSSLRVLNCIDLSVTLGQFVSVIGPSGSGKTTLLKITGGLITPTEGTIQINGVFPEEAQRRRCIGFVFQDPSLLPWRTVKRNITLPLEIAGAGQKSHHEITDRLLDLVDLSKFREYYPHQLSGGMKQRVALARAFALEPFVLLMDEPLGSLDELTRSSMQYEILRLCENTGKTVIFITHSISEAVLLSDRVVVLSPRPGTIVKDIEIGLPRPRTDLIQRSARFLDYTYFIKECLASGAPSDTHTFGE